jgi:hypothetical protein
MGLMTRSLVPVMETTTKAQLLLHLGRQVFLTCLNLKYNFDDGAAYVIFGQVTPSPNSFDISGLSSSSNPKGFKLCNNALGCSVSNGGDVNDKCFDDLIVLVLQNKTRKNSFSPKYLTPHSVLSFNERDGKIFLFTKGVCPCDTINIEKVK